MSFMLTKDQVYNRQKDVTRRMGWAFLKAGDILNAVEKGMGLKKGEKVVRICQIRVISSRWEPLIDITDNSHEVVREGFPHMTSMDFVEMFIQSHKDCDYNTPVNRIEFEYL